MSDPHGPPPTEPRLRLLGISKIYPSVVANADVDLAVMPGEIHAVLGENGAGKSTLMKMIYGVTKPDAGEIMWEGRQVHIDSPSAARRLGIGMVFQHFALFETLTVAENIALALDEKTTPSLLAPRIRAVSEQYGLPLDPDRLVHSMSVGERQRVEIVRCLLQSPRLLIMDEPTSVLTPDAVQKLFVALRRLRDEGVSILYISHKLDEIQALCDRATVLRAGRVAGTADPRVETAQSLAGLMIGGDLPTCTLAPRAPGDVLMAIVNLDLPSIDPFGTALRSISLELRAGEIVGLAGLQGSGRTELARALFGADRASAGTVEVDGKPVGRGPRAGIKAGMGFITEDRKLEGLALAQPIRDNTLLALRSLGGKQRRRLPGTVSVQELARSVELRARSLEQEARFLSGGNQQKVVLAKWLAIQPGVLIFDEPTRGVDVGAKAGIHDLMRGLAREGVAILMISSEMPELIGVADRILVMRGGRLAGELPAGAAETEIMALAAADEPVEAA